MHRSRRLASALFVATLATAGQSGGAAGAAGSEIHRTSAPSVIAPQDGSGDWPMFRRGPSHTGYDPHETTLSPSTVSGLQLTWSLATGGWVRSSPVVVNGIVYVGSTTKYLYALDATSGALLWRFHAPSSIVSSPAVVGGVVYFGAWMTFYALDAQTGQKLWQAEPGGYVDSAPAVVDGMVYIGVHDYQLANVYALDADTGAEVWRFTPFPYGTFSPPAVADGLVFTGSGGDGSFYALDARTGQEKWTFQTAHSVVRPAAVSGGVVFLSDGGTLYALEELTGHELWETGPFEGSAPAVAPGTVYETNPFPVALDRSTGDVLWSKSVYVGGDPTVANGVLYVAGSGGVDVIGATNGRLITTLPTSGAVLTSITVSNGMVYVGSTDRHVYAFGLAGQVSPGRSRPSP